MVQDQGYMVDVTSLPNQALIIFGEWLKMCGVALSWWKITFTIGQFWPFFFDRCAQFVQLMTVDMQNNRLVPWKQFKKYHTFPIPPNRQHNLFFMQFSFWFCLWWFITLGPWSFSDDIIVNNTLLTTSDNSFQKRIELRCKSQALMRYVKWTSFNSCGIQISNF